MAHLALIILVLFLTGVGVYHFVQVRKMFRQAREFSIKEQQFNQITKSINDQYKTCQNLISQQQGNFGSFEYCKQYIEWANTLPLSF